MYEVCVVFPAGWHYLCNVNDRGYCRVIGKERIRVHLMVAIATANHQKDYRKNYPTPEKWSALFLHRFVFLSID